MSQAKKVYPLYLFLLIFGLLLLCQAACSDEQQTALAQAAQVLSNEADQNLAEPSEIVLAGQIEDENGRWLNNYVVVLFKNGTEVDRATSGLMDSPFSNNGPMDGVFELRISNAYKLTLAHEIYHPNRALVPMHTVTDVVGAQYLGTWFDDLNPNDLRLLNVPDKQLEYALVVLPMPQNELPDSYSEGALSFQNGMLIIESTVSAEETTVEAETETAVAHPIPTASQPNVRFTILPSRNNGNDWHLQMTGYYGNRWDVWDQFIAGHVPGMDWETFKDAVLVHNPQLEADSFVFYPEKSYLLPFNQ